MKFVFTLMIAVVCFTQLEAQKIYATRNGKISFTSPTDEDVRAINNEVASRIADNGQLTFSLLMKGFKFKLAEMQEHFNDQYVESVKFPRADFKGNIINLNEVDFNKDGSYKISVKGDLTMHGVTKNITANGSIEMKAGKPIANAKFTMLLKDFSINAGSVTDKVMIDISCQYQ